jgi:predicted nucleic acid-binding protein
VRDVLVDSSAFLSLEDPDERAHEATTRAFQDLIADGARLLSTNFVFDESYTLILTRLGRHRAVAWGESLRSSRLIELARVEQDHEQAAWDLIVAFGDKDFSYTDATSFAVAQSLEIDEAMSVDRHFHEYGGFLRVLP